MYRSAVYKQANSVNLWEGVIQVHWQDVMSVVEPADQPWNVIEQQVRARALHPYDSMPAKLRSLPSGPIAPPIVLRQQPLAQAPPAVQVAAQAYLNPNEHAIEPSCVVLQSTNMLGLSFRNFVETCLMSLRSQPNTILVMEPPAMSDPSSSSGASNLPESAASDPPAQEPLYFIVSPNIDEPSLVCINGSTLYVVACARFDPRKQPRRSALVSSQQLPPRVYEVPGHQAERPKSLDELEAERQRLLNELRHLQTTSKINDHHSWLEDDPIVEYETKDDMLMKELASNYGKMLWQSKVEKFKALQQGGEPPPAWKKKRRVGWVDGCAGGSENSEFVSATMPGCLGKKRREQQRNEGNSKIARLMELEEAARKGTGRAGTGKGPQRGVASVLDDEQKEDDEEIKYWMGAVGLGDPWADMGPLGVDRGLLEALQLKVVLPGDLKAAAVVCLWHAAGLERCQSGWGVNGGSCAKNTDVAGQPTAGNKPEAEGFGVGGMGEEKCGQVDGGGLVAGAVQLIQGFQLPLRRRNGVRGAFQAAVAAALRQGHPAPTRRHSLQEVLFDEDLASHVASLGPLLARDPFKELRGTRLLYLLNKGWRLSENLSGQLGALQEHGVDIKQPSKAVRADCALNGNELVYDILMVPTPMAAGDPHQWLVRSLRGWLMLPIRVVEDNFFMQECMMAISHAMRQKQDPRHARVIVCTGVPSVELYPLGVQIVMNSSSWLSTAPRLLANLCALLAAGAHLYPNKSWAIRMRRFHTEEVVAKGSNESVAVLRLAWEAHVFMPLQQDEVSSNTPHPIPQVVRDTMKAAIVQRRAARFFITAYKLPVPLKQQQERLKEQELQQQQQQQQQQKEKQGHSHVKSPAAVGAEEDVDIAAHAGRVPSILHGSVSEVKQFLEVVLCGRSTAN